MILLMAESKRYLPYFEEEMGIKLNPFVEKTPYGEVVGAKNEDVIWIDNIGMYPMGIAAIMDKYRPDCLGMVSKVGGINKLLNVGDIMLVTDYIDNTTCRPKSYIEQKDKKIKIRYAMGEPFCKTWRNSVEQILKEKRNEFDGNIFDNGVYVCMDGPGFESTAEINAFRSWGADMVGHWISPFVYYARELDVCFVSVGVVSNVYHKDGGEMNNDDSTNKMFGKLYKILVETQPEANCNCQKSNILQYEEYK